MRIRTIKPEFWSHPVMARLEDHTQLLALALLSDADDEGYFRADVNIVRGSCMPFREDLATISRSLAKLSEVGWIEVAEHPDQGQIGRIVNWEKHQRVDHPKSSKLKCYFIRENVAKPSREPRENLAPDQGTGNREQGNGSGKEKSVAERNGGHIWKLWVDTHRKAEKPDPVPDGPDVAAGKKLASLIPKGKEEKILRWYMLDSDPFLTKAGNPLRMLPGRLNAYIKMAADPSLVNPDDDEIEQALKAEGIIPK